jgi:hypothetical protein
MTCSVLSSPCMYVGSGFMRSNRCKPSHRVCGRQERLLCAQQSGVTTCVYLFTGCKQHEVATYCCVSHI